MLKLRRYGCFSILLLLVAFGAGICSAQVQYVPTGTPPFNSLGAGPDVVNLGNLNAHFSIPVFQKGGGWSTEFPFSFGGTWR